MSASEKWPLLVIGKSRNPRCFKNVKTLPVSYKANRKAWMTGDMFEEWVRNFEKKMVRKNRKVLLFVDNCAAHGTVKNLVATKVVFLPPNTTSVLQPCDQGIIKAFKQHYRKRIVRYLLHCMESNISQEINVKIAIDFMHAAWKAVTPSVIQHCFRKGGFKTEDDVDEIRAAEDDEDDEDSIPLARLTNTDWNVVTGTTTTVTFDEYVQVDDGLVTNESDTLSDIAESVQTAHSDSDSDIDDSTVSDTITETETVSNLAAMNALRVIQNYIGQSRTTCSDSLFTSVGNIRDFIISQPNINTVQTNIRDYFVRK